MNQKHLAVALLVALTVTLAVTIVEAQGPKPTPPKPKAPTANAGTAFTYQGQLRQNGALVNGTCDFRFGLWDDSALGNQVGVTQSVNSLAVTNGLFTTPIDFDSGAFSGDARWLAIRVNCGSGLTSLNPRQALTPAPMAFALPGLYTEQNGTSPNVIGGYSGNVITPTLVGATISGGGASGAPNLAWANFATIGGGDGNLATNQYATVGGGSGNEARNKYVTISGGSNNLATNQYAAISGGSDNTANGYIATVSGGYNNQAIFDYDTVVGGHDNIASGGASTVAGAANTASGEWATVPGGANNTAGGAYSFAAGYRAKANNAGSFVWADSNVFDFSDTGSNEFKVRATGGIRMVVSIDGSGNMVNNCLLSSASGWSCSSDRNVKENFTAINPRTIAEQVGRLPLSEWNFKQSDPNVKHIGPMAQDFRAAFGLGDSDTLISQVDAQGVALAAIQGLYQIVQDKDEKISSLRTQVANQQMQIDSQGARLAVLEQAMKGNGVVVHAESNPASSPWVLFGGLIVVGMVFWRHNAGGK